MKKERAIALVDGEHYFPVIIDGLNALAKQYEVVGAVFLGGTEKIGSKEDLNKLGVPVILKDNLYSAIKSAVEKFSPDVAVDLSDEPIVGYYERFEIANLLLAAGVSYKGVDFDFFLPKLEKVALPSLSVAGTGKRIGKTSIAGYIALLLKQNYKTCIVTMGRGGPAEPEVLHGENIDLSPERLVELAEQGRHAASDHFEDALMARVLTIGCRRCGGGMSGRIPFTSNVLQGKELAENSNSDIIIFEGSGSTFPPVETNQTILIIGAHQPLDYIQRYFGPYRILQSDLVILTMCEVPDANEEKIQQMVDAIKKVKDIPIIKTIFRPKPLEDITGEKIFLATTAPKKSLPKLIEYLESKYSCKVVGTSSSLSNRPILREDISASNYNFDTMLVELKAAGVDVAAKLTLSKGKRVVFLDNIPLALEGNLDKLILDIAQRAISKKGFSNVNNARD